MSIDPRPLRIALVNDYEIILQGLHALLEPFAERVRVVEHEIGGTPDQPVDIALYDTFGGRRDALARAAEMVGDGHVGHVVLYTWDASPALLAAARDTGVAAVLRKSLNGLDLVHALEQVAGGRPVEADTLRPSTAGDDPTPLTTREREVLALLALGYRNAEIAEELYLSVDTVKTHVRKLFGKLGVHNRTQAALLADEYGLGPPAARLARFMKGQS